MFDAMIMPAWHIILYAAAETVRDQDMDLVTLF